MHKQIEQKITIIRCLKYSRNTWVKIKRYCEKIMLIDNKGKPKNK